MSDRGSSDGGWEEQPTEFVPPPRRDEPTEGSDLPPIGADRDPEPTRVVPTPPPAEPTVAMPSTGGPYGPGGPYVPPGGGGPGGPGGPGDEPPYGEEPEQPWYRQPGPVAALIAGAAALILGLIALLVIRSDDDDNDGDNTLPTVSSSSTTTTLPPPVTTSTPTTVPATTTTTPATTTTSTTTTLPPTTTTTTTLPPTTTTLPPTTTTAPTTTTTAPPGPSAWDVLQDTNGVNEFVAAIQSNNLVDLVDGPQPVTILAPENGFPGPLNGEGVRRQIIGEAFTEGQLFNETSVQTLSGASLDVDGPARTVGDVTIETPDIEASNGFIQVVSGLVTPS